MNFQSNICKPENNVNINIPVTVLIFLKYLRDKVKIRKVLKQNSSLICFPFSNTDLIENEVCDVRKREVVMGIAINFEFE